jgi:hypothetical protein
VTISSGGSVPNPDATNAVAGLAREFEAMGALIQRLVDLPDRVAELGGLLAQLADEVAEHTKTPQTGGPTSWLAFPTDGQPAAVLADLGDWMARIYLRFPDAAHHLPGCWLWHPDVVEELLWLRQVWAVAYHPRSGAPTQVGDWHDRYRPGVVRRIRERAGTCSLERHSDQAVGAAPVVPVSEAVDLIASWWRHHQLQPPPIPSELHLASAERQRGSWADGRR